MAAAASVTIMLSIAPVTANTADPTVYTSQDEFIPLSAPIYNWNNSNKALRFKVKLAYNYNGGADFALIDKDGQYCTNSLSFKLKLGTVSYGGTLTDLTGSGTMRWYQCSTVTVNIANGTTTLSGATVNYLGSGWYHIELPLNKFTPYYGQVSNPGSRTLDVISFDWVNHTFLMRDFRVA